MAIIKGDRPNSSPTVEYNHNIPQTIQKSSIVKNEDDRYSRTNVKAFYTLKCPVKIGEQKEVGCFVGKKADGKTYYDLYISKTVAGEPQSRARANNGLDTKSIGQDTQVVNLFILDKE